jgi:hypothetical protein
LSGDGREAQSGAESQGSAAALSAGAFDENAAASGTIQSDEGLDGTGSLEASDRLARTVPADAEEPIDVDDDFEPPADAAETTGDIEADDLQADLDF